MKKRLFVCVCLCAWMRVCILILILHRNRLFRNEASEHGGSRFPEIISSYQNKLIVIPPSFATYMMRCIYILET